MIRYEITFYPNCLDTETPCPLSRYPNRGLKVVFGRKLIQGFEDLIMESSLAGLEAEKVILLFLATFLYQGSRYPNKRSKNSDTETPNPVRIPRPHYTSINFH